ncbi:MAG: LPS assembly lipoprotein LptE [Gammaproteobacteria bacterium]|nr:LPS assembly lipoprotein LptE [Gammaproteobacteria bacterium]MCW8986157.1 LPS assembly lipoprotein LptE [Gammaproteobacteria bacterium]
MEKIKFTLLILLSGFIISCGFHLRGNQDLSAVLPEVQVLGINKHSELGRDLLRALNNSKVNVLDESATILTITQDNISKRVLSLDSAGRANQYELSYQLGFSLQKIVQSDGEKQQLLDLIAAQRISEKREYLFDANLVLAKSDEVTKLNNDMRQSAILQLLRRLKFSLEAKN